MTRNANQLTPTSEKQRYVILDALRGFALLGICLANLPEFSLWTFLPSEAQEAMPTAQADHVVRFLQYFLVDAKFYGIFSMLFGIGFSIILSHAQEKGNSGIRLFYMTGLALLFLKTPHARGFSLLAKPGRMALTNYISQSVFGIVIYYGIGFGLGLSMGLWQVELTSIAIFIAQIIISSLWMHYFRFGPLEWIWRMLTYGKWLPILKSQKTK